ncbi:MAG: GNAT family N-acetyltransferase [Leptonema sp. (in: bacteria)]
MQNILTKERQLEVKLAENQLEIERTLSLRYEIFNEELNEGLPESKETKKDRDEYDYYCDHLIVIDKKQDSIVGTYRILKGSIAKKNIGFYSENEFDLSSIYKLQDEVAEIGRGCVKKEYRDGSVISLLWKGLADYIKKNNIRYLMGCGSFHTNDSTVISEAYAYFKKKNYLISEGLRVKPRNDKVLNNFRNDLEIKNLREVARKIPPLINSYLFIGAKIGGEPAYDEIFKTTDFFIFFDVLKITERYGERYLGNKEKSI